MTEPTQNYHALAGMYQLFISFSAMTLTDDPGGPTAYASSLDSAMSSEHARDIITTLLGAALGGYIEKHGGDVSATMTTLAREYLAAQDLASLNDEVDEV